jgi:hypothetical protein
MSRRVTWAPQLEQVLLVEDTRDVSAYLNAASALQDADALEREVPGSTASARQCVDALRCLLRERNTTPAALREQCIVWSAWREQRNRYERSNISYVLRDLFVLYDDE